MRAAPQRDKSRGDEGSFVYKISHLGRKIHETEVLSLFRRVLTDLRSVSGFGSVEQLMLARAAAGNHYFSAVPCLPALSIFAAFDQLRESSLFSCGRLERVQRSV